MSSDQDRLLESWRTRNAAAGVLGQAEINLRRALAEASINEIASLIDTYSPALSAGPEWTRTFEMLIERLWTWRDDATMAALAEVYKARGMPWAAVANALAPPNGARIRGGIRHPAWARLPALTWL